MNKYRKLFALLLLCVFGVAGCSGSTSTRSDQSEEVTREIVFTADDMDETRDDEFSATIEEDGQTYQLDEITYDIIDKTPKETKVTKTVESDILPADQTYTPQDTIEEDGVTYTLESTETQEGVLEEAYSQPVTGYTDYSYQVSSSSVPATKDVTVTNVKTGQEQTVTCSLTGVSRLPAEYENTYIDIVYESYDANQFIWGDTVVSKNEITPEIDENQLLASVGADPESCDVQRVYWTGQPYTDAAGVLCRNARADVRRLVNYYRADYSGSLEHEAVAGTKYVSTYTGSVADESAGFDYKIMATAHYVEQASYSALIVAGVGFLILAVVVVVLLFMISRKNKKKGES